jgi:hypothetical protein
MCVIVPTLFDHVLTDIGSPTVTVSRSQAEQLFTFFQQHPLFNWTATNDGCEGRADAVCLLMDAWGIPNYKGWVFGGLFLKNHIGGLIQNWNYHVAPVLAVQEEGQVVYYVLDPATGGSLQLIDDWAAGITQYPHSYYCIRQAHWYIFPAGDINTADWHTRNRRNRKWMIQALAGIFGLTSQGKARKVFNKERLWRTLLAFKQAKRERPFLY